MKILAFVLAGGAGTRLYPLTAEHAKPAVPFVNGFRIVDFVLSNLVNSKTSTIYVLAQYKPESLIKHIDTAWAPSSTRPEDFVRIVLPRSQTISGAFQGTVDAVYQNLDLIAQHEPDLVAVFAADQIYRMDVRQMADFHQKRKADVTVSAVPVPIEIASSFTIMVTGSEGCIHRFQEEPVHPAGIPTNPARAHASMGNYLFDPHVLIGLLEEAVRRRYTDFGRDIMPTLPRRFRVFAYDFYGNYVPGVQNYEERGYWRDVDTLEALAAAQEDVSGSQPRFHLWNHHWPIQGDGHSALLAKLRDWKAQPTRADLPADLIAASQRMAISPQRGRADSH